MSKILNSDSDMVLTRRKILKSWNHPYAVGIVHGKRRIIGEFRAVTHNGDFLSRNKGDSNAVSCDKFPCANSNSKFVPDSSDYTTYKKQRAFNLSRKK
jgi:hypothetical protein